MKQLLSFILAVAAMTASAPASAKFAKPEDAVKYRKSVMFVMQQNYARVGAMVAGKAPFDAKVAAESAAVAEYMSKLPWVGFAAGTEQGDTRAKPEIWKEPARFKDYGDKMQLEMSAFAAAARAGSLEGVKTTFEATGEACKTCHDTYRNK
jgi:cytochrome c556